MFKNKLCFLVGACLVATSTITAGQVPYTASVKNDLLCIAIEGVDDNKSALAVLRVQKDGQAQGALCYLDTLQVADLEDCHAVAGRVLTAPRAAKASFVGLVGTGIDKDNLIQNDVAVRFKPNNETGLGAATEFTVMAPTLTPTLTVTGVGKAYQGACRYDPRAKVIMPAQELQLHAMIGLKGCRIAGVQEMIWSNE